jgi:hypothetical protein
MLRRRIRQHRRAIGFITTLASLPAQAQDLAAPGAFGADMLPQGRSAVRLETRGTWADEEYSPNGDRRALGSNYNGLNLNAAMFPALSPLGPGATLGTTHLAARMSAQQTRLTVGYGLSEDVTVGFQVGYGEVENKVDVSVSGSNLAATGNPAMPYVPLGAFGTTIPTGTQDVQNLLTGLYGYKPVQSSTWRSALDPLIGLRWRFDKGENYATVFAPTLRFGVAKAPDPNDLMQMVLGDGTNDILLGVLHTRKLSDRWDLLLSAQYTVQLADHITARARSANELLVPASRLESLSRDRTNPIELTAESGYALGAWRLSGRLEYAYGGKDHYSSPSGQDVSGLEANTDFHYLLGYLGVSWNGIPGYLSGEHKAPVLVSLVAATTLAAKNTSAPDSLYLTVTLPF